MIRDQFSYMATPTTTTTTTSTTTTSMTTTTTTMSESQNDHDFIWTTATHNYVSREAEIRGAQQVEMRGRSVIHRGVVMAGDVAWIRIGRYSHLSEGTLITPPELPLLWHKKQHVPQHAPVTICWCSQVDETECSFASGRDWQFFLDWGSCQIRSQRVDQRWLRGGRW